MLKGHKMTSLAFSLACCLRLALVCAVMSAASSGSGSLDPGAAPACHLSMDAAEHQLADAGSDASVAVRCAAVAVAWTVRTAVLHSGKSPSAEVDRCHCHSS